MANAYESLHTLKEAATQISMRIDSLTAAGLLEPETARIQKLTIEELGASICQAAMLRLAEHEQETSARLEK
ncbi:MAG TPA: hypothetical protein VKZ53_27090, partial [Candidatus Angelobacter sp.]|nr:hypothetical protein [Candidatus Angelobacter sp.]